MTDNDDDERTSLYVDKGTHRRVVMNAKLCGVKRVDLIRFLIDLLEDSDLSDVLRERIRNLKEQS